MRMLLFQSNEVRRPIILDSEPIGSVKKMSIYRVSDAPPDWAEEDPSQPDYIKNKPVLVAGKNVVLTQNGNEIIISVNGAITPDEPETPDVPDIPDIPSEDGTIIDKIVSNEISVYLSHDGVEELVPFKVLGGSSNHTEEGFYVVSNEETIENAGYQVTFRASNSDEPQYILIPKEIVIINSYQYVPNLGQWFQKGFDETYWVANGEVTKTINGEEIIYTKYVFNSELWGDPIRTTEYWRFEMEA